MINRMTGWICTLTMMAAGPSAYSVSAAETLRGSKVINSLGMEMIQVEPTASRPVLWDGGKLPASSDIPLLPGVRFHVIKPYEYLQDGYRWLHGTALAWHGNRLYAKGTIDHRCDPAWRGSFHENMDHPSCGFPGRPG